jgi:hypothetical protein
MEYSGGTNRPPNRPPNCAFVFLRGAVFLRADSVVAEPQSANIIVRDGERLSLLELEQVTGNYVRVHSGGRTYLTRTTMDRMAQRLAGAQLSSVAAGQAS